LAAAAAFTGSAVAADMAVKARPIVTPIAYSWAGCYIGVNVGGKSARTTDSVIIPATANSFTALASSGLDLGSADSSTFIGGGQAGCNWQTGNVVFGIEGDADAQSWRRSETLAGTALPSLFTPGDRFDLKSDWQASIRGRIGYTWDRTLLYATGGVAFTNVRADTTWIPSGPVFPAAFGSDNRTLVGATVGAGLEYAFTNNLSLGVEGRYSWYGTQTFGAGLLPVIVVLAPGPQSITFAAASRSIKVETGEVMAKLNWKFNSFGPVARY
jgi:outer membrane immunogenic protein